jgi:hypothetical protein
MSQEQCQDKPAIGSVPSPVPIGNRASLLEPAGLLDNQSLVKEATDTGKCWSHSPRKSLLPLFAAVSPEQDTMNQPALKRRKRMSKKKIQEMENPLNLEPSPFKETLKKTGIKSETSQLQVIYSVSRPTSSYVVTARYGELLEVKIA